MEAPVARAAEHEPEHGAERVRGAPVPRRAGFRAWLVLVALVALGMRLAFLAELDGSPFRDERGLIADARFYDDRAQEIADGDLIGTEPGYLSPVYCYAMGAVYAFLGPDPWNMKLAQALLGAATCALVALVGRRVFGARAGIAAGLAFALYPVHVWYTGLILPTIVETLCNVGCLALLLPDERGFRARRTLAAGVVLGLAIGAKPNALLMIPVALAWLALALRGRGRGTLAGHAAALGLGIALAVAPITWRNHAVSGELVLVSVVGGRNLMKGNGPDADGSHVFLAPGAQGVSLHVVGEHDLDPSLPIADDRRMKQEALDWVLANPGRSAFLFAKKAYLFLNAHELGIRDQYAFARDTLRTIGWNPLGFGVIVPLGLVGAWFALRRGPPAWLLHGALLVQIVSFVIVFVLARYRLVAVACLTVFAFGELDRWLRLGREGRARLVLPALFLLAPAALLVNAPSGFERERGYADQHAFIAQRRFEQGDLRGSIEAWHATLDASWQNERAHMQRDVVLERIAGAYLELGELEHARRAGRDALRAADELPPERAARRKEQIRRGLAGLDLGPDGG
jgi:4-amino-4-deoxy-L-arabinose transferase-like glycosyltransferase